MSSKGFAEQKELNNHCDYPVEPETPVEESKCAKYKNGECNKSCYICIDAMMRNFGTLKFSDTVLSDTVEEKEQNKP